MLYRSFKCRDICAYRSVAIKVASSCSSMTRTRPHVQSYVHPIAMSSGMSNVVLS